MQFCTTLSPCYEVIKWHHIYNRSLYKQGQLGGTVIDTLSTAVSGSLCCFIILSQIGDKFPYQLPLQEEQRLLKDNLFHGRRKSIRDSLKYCFADTSIDYMQFLEECRKSEEEGKAGQARAPCKG